MLLRNSQKPRRGIILLVVLALITLFASIGVAFVYFAEQEATKSIDQKAGETIKLPDSDIMYAYVMKQIVFPTNNTSSVLFTHSLIENEYGRTGVVPYSGTGPRPRLFRDSRPGVVDPQLAAGYTTNPALNGQDSLFRINRAITGYNELLQGSLNPTYTYPDHRNAYLGGVSANWTDMNGNQHGPVAVARSFAREMKFRIAVIDTTVGAGLPNVLRYQDVIINPFSISDYSFWRTVSDPTIALTALEWQNFYVKRITLPPVAAPQAYAATAGVTAARPVLPPPPGTPSIQCSPDGTIAYLVMDAATCRAHTLRPDPRTNPNFPPPTDAGGDVKNLPPEVRSLVGFNGTTPIFANNDSYWMDIGFPAIPWSNNRRIKPMAAVTIIDLDGKVNMNTGGNLRGADPTNGTYHTSAHGLIPAEINPRKLYPATPIPALAAQMDQEIRQLLGGLQLTQNQFIRGKYGIDPNTGLAVDPSTLAGNTGYPPFGNFSMYAPLLRPAPYYSGYNIDGTFDNFVNPPVPNYTWSPAFTLPGQSLAYGRFPANNLLAQGYGNGLATEYFRNTAARSPLFVSPFAPTQPSGNAYSNNVTGSQRTFGLYNAEAMYRLSDTGGDKIDSDLRKLMPILFSDARSRWQMTPTSMDLNAAGVAPWFNSNTGDSVMPRITPPAPPGAAAWDSHIQRPAGPSRQLPWAPPASGAPPFTPQGEFVAQGPAPTLWRSIFGNSDRIDLTRQLPDYPLPVNVVTGVVDPNAHLDMANPVVRAQFLIALHARQKLVDQIFGKLVYLTHPDITAGPTSMNSPRWLAQLAVNIVDYIDNDDYPTWFQVPTLVVGPTGNLVAAASPASVENFVWGTELPRLVINEVYAEAVNSTTSTSPMGNTIADAAYHVRHWVELYNPLHDFPFAAWPDRANARLTVNGTSAYRLIITPQLNVNDNTNTTTEATGIRGNQANRLGYPINTADGQTNVVLFNGTTAANVNIPPSGANYGPLVPPDTANGFYLVAPQQPPLNTDPMSTFPTMASNPNNMYESPQMQVDQRIAQATTAFGDTQANRQSILLQRLANPYLPHNPMPGPNTTFPTETPHNPLLPYNPYITIDYVEHVIPNHAIAHTSQDSPSNADMTPVDQRSAIGKLQPYAALHNRRANLQLSKLQWTTQTPDRDLTVAGIDALQNQVQHTFFRHNSIEDTNPRYGQPAGGATRSASANTVQLPFDWLVHLDRQPTSPAELLHVSGYRPHELTQQFHNMLDRPVASGVDTIPPTPGPTLNLTPGTNLRFTASAGGFIGTLQGIPYTLKLNDLVYVTYILNPAGTQVSHWVRVNNIDPNYTWFDAEYNSPNTQVVDKNGFAKMAVPYAHTAPWYRATENVPIHSSNRLYRLLETLAVRNPGIDIGQVRFQGIGVGPVQADGSRWIQLNNQAGIPGMPLVTTNDALLGIETGTPAAMQLPAGVFPFNQPTYAPFTPATPAYPAQVGDTVVFYAGTPAEQRAMVLEVNWQTNQIRTVLPVVPPARTFTVDYTYHSGRQPGKINLNTVWDLETFLALADVKTMNAFFHDPKAIAPNVPPAIIDREALVKLAFQRLYQQRQPGYFYIPRLVGHTGINNVGEDRPLQGMGTGDIAPDIEIARQGIGNTYLSDRHQEGPAGFAITPTPRTADMTQPVPYEAAAPMAGVTPIYSTPERMLSTLFEMYLPQPAIPAAPVVPTFLPDPGMNHPYRRFELLSKIWNNTTTRSNTFAVWVTIGFFEYDEVTGIGAELGQTTGKNTRYRFFSIVDRSSIDGWLKGWQNWDSTASVDRFANTNQFPTLDPRDLTFMQPPVISNNFGPVAGAGNVWQVTIMPEFGNPYYAAGAPPTFHFGQLVDVEGLDGAGNPIFERTMLLDPTNDPAAANQYTTYSMRHVHPPQFATVGLVPQQQLFVRLTKPYAAGLLTIRSVPIPPTVLHWSQLK